MEDKHHYRLNFEVRYLDSKSWIKGQREVWGPSDAGIVLASVLPYERNRLNVAEIRLNEMIRL